MYDNRILSLFAIGAVQEVSKIRKSPGIMKSLSEPVPLPGEDKVSYERHIKALQVCTMY